MTKQKTDRAFSILIIGVQFIIPLQEIQVNYKVLSGCNPFKQKDILPG